MIKNTDLSLVSFVVPCYKLGHLLAECIDSILGQTYEALEVVIMDDCSPDHTADVANAYTDPRVRYVRNEQNLGHLRNYNKGIELSRGKYVWLISADDRLRVRHVLSRYVEVMEDRPNIGFVCCPGIGLKNAQETGLVNCGDFGPRDRVFGGREFIGESLDKGYGLLAPSVMARKACYEKVCAFPLDMPHQGDWYLWFQWALEYDVAYLSEPMVNYRDHDLNIMKKLFRGGWDLVLRDEVNLLWRTKQACELKGFNSLAQKCQDALANKYGKLAAVGQYEGFQSICRSSFLRWSFDHGRSEVLRFGIPRDTRWRIDGVPLFLVRRLCTWSLRWMIALDPSQRFFRKTQVWKLAGKLVQCHRESVDARLGVAMGTLGRQ